MIVLLLMAASVQDLHRTAIQACMQNSQQKEPALFALATHKDTTPAQLDYAFKNSPQDFWWRAFYDVSVYNRTHTFPCQFSAAEKMKVAHYYGPYLFKKGHYFSLANFSFHNADMPPVWKDYYIDLGIAHNEPLAYFMRATQKDTQGLYSQAIDLYRQIVDQPTENFKRDDLKPQAILNLGLLLRATGNLKDAKIQLLRLISPVNPINLQVQARAYANLLPVLKDLGETIPHSTYFQQALSFAERNQGEISCSVEIGAIYFAHGQLHEYNDNDDVALQMYQQSYSLNQSSMSAGAIGYIHLKKHMGDQAKTWLDLALQKAPNNHHAIVNRVAVYCMTNSPVDELDAFLQAHHQSLQEAPAYIQSAIEQNKILLHLKLFLQNFDDQHNDISGLEVQAQKVLQGMVENEEETEDTVSVPSLPDEQPELKADQPTKKERKLEKQRRAIQRHRNALLEKIGVRQNNLVHTCHLPPLQVSPDNYHTLQTIFRVRDNAAFTVQVSEFGSLCTALGGTLEIDNQQFKLRIPRRGTNNQFVERQIDWKHNRDDDSGCFSLKRRYDRGFIKQSLEEAGYYDISAFQENDSAR